jgi:hypothetical protein
MVLNFNNQNGYFAAEFEATGNFNLHIERSESGYLYVMQRTSPSGKYDNVRGASFEYDNHIVDFDFTGSVFPKQIQVVSKVMPTMAEVTFAE